jgi:cytidine deaminase
MQLRELTFTYRAYANAAELSAEDAALLNQAKAALSDAYAPYSNFRVAATLLLANGKTVTGTNQENAAFPAGTCAEGTALGAASALYPNVAIKKIAITVKSGTHVVKSPTAPCGICRQRILEYENRFNQPIEIILAGEEGEVFSVQSVKDILPLNFSKADL